MALADRRTLSDLPPPSGDIFPLRHPWCPVSARVLTASLNTDHGLLGLWRMRGVGPQALPTEWTIGHRHAFLVSDVLAWLARRRGEPFDTTACWRAYLAETAGMDIEDPHEVRKWASRYARSAGPNAYAADGVRFNATGFTHYLEALAA